MPTTVNGIGTHYYGKRNKQVRTDRCQACGRVGKLTSYSTRLWFVIFFVPIIPLRRKRITDDCSNCRRHWAADEGQWETARQLTISGAIEQYRERPSVETALDVHAKMLAFRMLEEAERFRNEVVTNYSDSAALHAGLAGHLDAVGRSTEATPLLTKALGLRPDLPEVRCGMAARRLVEGKLDEARELLSYLLEPGAAQTGDDLNRLMQLAEYYQRARRHEDALAICKHVLAENPACAEIYAFRKFVAKSEAALRSKESMLPPRKFSLGSFLNSRSGAYAPSQRYLAIGAVVLVLLAVGMAVHNEYRRQHRTVFILNDLGQKVPITVDKSPEVMAGPTESLVLSEGRHHVKVGGPIPGEFDMDVRSGYFERWSKSPVWAINVGGAAPVALEIHHYAAKNPKPMTITFHVGTDFVAIKHADYVFEDTPPQLTNSSQRSEIIKTRFARLQSAPNEVFEAAITQTDHEPALRFAESHLRVNPNDEMLLYHYAAASAQAGKSERVLKFLKEERSRRPISVTLHRYYQEEVGREHGGAELAAEYDAELKKEPTSAALLYLRGRVTEDRTESHRFFRRSTEVDPKFFWGWYALAYDAAAIGDWKASRGYADKVFRAGQIESAWRPFWFEIRAVTGDAPALEAECRQQLGTKQPGEVVFELGWLCNVLALQGKIDAGKAAMHDWEQRLPPPLRTTPRAQAVSHFCLYELGDLNAIVGGVAPPAPEGSDVVRIQALTALGRVTEAAKLRTAAKAVDDAWLDLALSVGFQIAKDEKSAVEWRKKACSGLEKLGINQRRAATLLRSSAVPTRQQLDNVVCHSTEKALVLAALALRFPKEADLAAYARRVNVSRFPPYHLVEKAIAAAH